MAETEAAQGFSASVSTIEAQGGLPEGRQPFPVLYFSEAQVSLRQGVT